ncbi:hypothetical protein [Maridesulfovibrio sp.]|uniref:hypothetical protein n=1 Tax=Maridesulfovibrio sp. TaxID=2795000 RepID=UPI002A18E768|nr:hypothetical protein [Maridesulfovibrio sp.]
MIQAKVDSRFLGTIQNTFYGLPPLPQPVKIFFSLILLGVVCLIARYYIRKYGLIMLAKAYLQVKFYELADKLKKKTEQQEEEQSEDKNEPSRQWRGTTDRDILDRLVMTGAKTDILGERSGQRTLAAIATVSGTEGIDVVVSFKDMVTPELLTPGEKVKCIFDEMALGSKKVNAFVGNIKSCTEDRGAVITRTSSFGFIRRRVFARRKVSDQRFIKIKIWRVEHDDYDVDDILDNAEADILIDNRKDLPPRSNKPHVVDISKGGLALIGSVREGINSISRNDRVIICMLIYMPARRTFQPHLIYAEVRAARTAGLGLTRMSFQFLRSLKIPPRKRSTLFKGQAVMAMNLANPE